jgi:hypoxanthine phosphoribosyltransferase
MMYSPECKLLISREAIALTVKRLAGDVSRDYHAKRPLLLGVLTGSFVFLADLMRCLDFPLEVDFVTLSSYGGATESCGIVKVVYPPRAKLEGRHILVVEDIVDSGLTTIFLLDYLEQSQSASVKLCSLLDKPARRKADVRIDYLGFTVPDKFIVGYGLDCNYQHRNLSDICYVETDK